MKLTHAPEIVANFVGKFGYEESMLPTIAILEICVALLYAIPKTSVLGAILVAAYLGGAVATHVRAHDMFAPPIALAVVAWLGLYFRDARVRGLVPLRG